ncbi:glycosyltransferase 87 family protein [Corynebacterium tapiri]|uniref:glycosyltransferase 87 family protein n=1 Tax=Corynebacterium tapiri TaxID=1448266 RepID=UPI0015D57A77|nr:glycosyltransferase 87 family protein [Corynebacterium tapiri]
MQEAGTTAFRPRLVGAGTISLLLAALGAFVVWCYLVAEEKTPLTWVVPIDLAIYQKAGTEVSNGGLLYDAPYIYDLPFTYPPFSGVLFQGLAGLNDYALVSVWHGAIALVVLAVLLMVLRERGFRVGPVGIAIALLFTLCLAGTEPLSGTFFFGQINVFLMGLVALDLIPRRLRLPGVGIGLAAGIKLTPAFMGLVLLIQRRWWAAVGSIVTFFITVAIGFWGIRDAKDFWLDAMFDSSRVGEHLNPGAQSLKSVLIRFFDLDSSAVWGLAVLATFALVCVAIYRAVKRENNTLAMCFAGIGACLISPFSWFHHWVWVLPLGFAILLGVNAQLGRRAHAWWQRQAVGAASVLAAVATLAPFATLLVIPNMPSDFYTPAGLLILLAYVVYSFAVPTSSRAVGS